METLHTELIPATHRESRKLLVALHGLGDSIEGYRWLPQVLALPWLNVLLVNAPDAYYGGFSWFDLYENAAAGVERSHGLLTGLFDQLSAQGFATEETVLFGFSQGCLMTMEVGFRYPKRFAGLIGVSGRPSDPAKLLREKSAVALEQRFLITHGDHDPIFPLADVRAQIDELRRGGAQIDWHEFNKAHTIAGDQEVGLIKRFIQGRFAPAQGDSGHVKSAS